MYLQPVPHACTCSPCSVHALAARAPCMHLQAELQKSVDASTNNTAKAVEEEKNVAQLLAEALHACMYAQLPACMIMSSVFHLLWTYKQCLSFTLHLWKGACDKCSAANHTGEKAASLDCKQES